MLSLSVCFFLLKRMEHRTRYVSIYFRMRAKETREREMRMRVNVHDTHTLRVLFPQGKIDVDNLWEISVCVHTNSLPHVKFMDVLVSRNESVYLFRWCCAHLNASKIRRERVRESEWMKNIMTKCAADKT